MTDYIITPLVSTLMSLITAVVTHILTKRRYHTEVDGNVIANMSESLAFYKILCDDNKKRLDEVVSKSNAMQSEIDRLRSNITSMLRITCDINNCPQRHTISNI